MITDDASLTLALGMHFLAGRYISCMHFGGEVLLVLGTARFGPSGSAAGEDRGSDDVDRGRRARVNGTGEPPRGTTARRRDDIGMRSP